MKVLMINGSPHQKGNTAIALGEIAKQLEKNGIHSPCCILASQDGRTVEIPVSNNGISALSAALET